MEDNSNNRSQYLSAQQQYVKWWPIVLGPVAMILVYSMKMIGWQDIVSRGSNEKIALVLVGICVAGFGVQAIKFRTEFHLFMLVLCAIFFCREWHFAGTSKGVYIALTILALWVVKRKDKLESIMDSRLKIWMWSTFGTYLLSQLIARRVFKYLCLPAEDQLHIFFEETVETTAHIMMIATCFIAFMTMRKMLSFVEIGSCPKS